MQTKWYGVQLKKSWSGEQCLSEVRRKCPGAENLKAHFCEQPRLGEQVKYDGDVLPGYIYVRVKA